MFLESRIHFQKAKIDRFVVFIENHLDDAEALVDRTEQRSIPFFAVAQRTFCLHASGDVVEEDGNSAAARPANLEGIRIEPTVAQLLRFVNKTNGLAGQRHPAQGFEPVRFMIRRQFTHPLSDRIDDTGQYDESRIHFQKTPVDWLVFSIKDHFDDAIAFVHKIEQTAIALFAASHGLLGLLAVGDVDVGGEGLDRLAIQAQHHGPPGLDPAQDPIVAENLVLNLAHGLAGKEVLECGFHSGPIIGNHMVQQRLNAD